jgi:hypothetical protein
MRLWYLTIQNKYGARLTLGQHLTGATRLTPKKMNATTLTTNAKLTSKRAMSTLNRQLIRMVERQPGRTDTTASTKSVAIRPVPSHTRRNSFGSYGDQPH